MSKTVIFSIVMMAISAISIAETSLYTGIKLLDFDDLGGAEADVWGVGVNRRINDNLSIDVFHGKQISTDDGFIDGETIDLALDTVSEVQLKVGAPINNGQAFLYVAPTYVYLDGHNHYEHAEGIAIGLSGGTELVYIGFEYSDIAHDIEVFSLDFGLNF